MSFPASFQVPNRITMETGGLQKFEATLTVMVQQDPGRGAADDERAAGHVARHERGSREAGRLSLHEREDFFQVFRLRGVRRDVPEQRVAKGPTGAIERHGPAHAGDLNSLDGRSGIIPEWR